MGFFVAPGRHAEFRGEIGEIMRRTKAQLDDALPFAMEPVVYDFRINRHGTHAELREGDGARMPARVLCAPGGADDRRGNAGGRARSESSISMRSPTGPTSRRS
jgi:hypothetical protein